MTEISEIGNARSISTMPRRIVSISFVGLEIIAIIFEAIVVMLSSICGGVLYHLVYYNVFYNVEGFVGIGVVGAVLHLFIAKSQGLYEIPVLAGLDRRWTRLVCGWLLVVLLLTLFIFLLKVGSGVSRGSVVTFGFVGCLALITGRSAFQRPLRQAVDRGQLAGRRAVLLGSAEELARLRPSDLLKNFGLTEVKRFTLADVDAGPNGPIHETSPIVQAMEAARHNYVDEIVLAVRWSQDERIRCICEQLRLSPLPVHLLPDRTTEYFLSLPTVTTGRFPTLELQRTPLTYFERALKRIVDIFAAAGTLLMLSPLLLVTALLVKLDSTGPVIFRQRRNGFDGRTFSILKFRTMHVMEDGDSVQQAKRDDARVTRIGRLLRRHSIDELPQLLNVIRGEMSLVGPRPHALVHDDKYSKLIASYAYRHHVKPGISGLAQVNGLRGETPRIEDMQKRVEYDLTYINTWNLMLDLRIMLKTFGEVLRNQAY
jgi:Undecaprenyl-phosphate glucose phosphotransferase